MLVRLGLALAALGLAWLAWQFWRAPDPSGRGLGHWVVVFWRAIAAIGAVFAAILAGVVAYLGYVPGWIEIGG